MSINDGGPAFPLLDRHIGYHADIQQTNPGMSLRDWFAGQALAGMAGCQHWPNEDDGPEMARCAYAFADAMLAARGQP